MVDAIYEAGDTASGWAYMRASVALHAVVELVYGYEDWEMFEDIGIKWGFFAVQVMGIYYKQMQSQNRPGATLRPEKKQKRVFRW